MLPALYTLDKVPAVGHLGRTVPFSISCPECGRNTQDYHDVDIVLESLPECDLVSAGGSYFASDVLLTKLRTIGARGYTSRSAVNTVSDQLHLAEPGILDRVDEMPTLSYLIVTGRCDGPWVRHERGSTCATCGQPRGQRLGASTSASEVSADLQRAALVWPETWHGEDMFYLSEPGPPIVTERIATLLRDTGNLRQEKVVDIDRVRQLMPLYAAQLERSNWLIDRCTRLGPADWVFAN
jgi:hypothetical protein